MKQRTLLVAIGLIGLATAVAAQPPVEQPGSTVAGLLIQELRAEVEELRNEIRSMDRMPVGTILAWYNREGGPVPAGWAVCDGSDGTPDLRGRFLRGVSTSDAVGRRGGSAKVTVPAAKITVRGVRTTGRNPARWSTVRIWAGTGAATDGTRSGPKAQSPRSRSTTRLPTTRSSSS